MSNQNPKKIRPASIDQILGRDSQTPREKMMGIMIYDHKTGGELMMVPASQFKSVKSAMDRKGQSSILRKVTPNGGRKI